MSEIAPRPDRCLPREPAQFVPVWGLAPRCSVSRIAQDWGPAVSTWYFLNFAVSTPHLRSFCAYHPLWSVSARIVLIKVINSSEPAMPSAGTSPVTTCSSDGSWACGACDADSVVSCSCLRTGDAGSELVGCEDAPEAAPEGAPEDLIHLIPAVEEELLCPVCLKPFDTAEERQPCVLQCFHDVCRQCAVTAECPTCMSSGLDQPGTAVKLDIWKPGESEAVSTVTSDVESMTVGDTNFALLAHIEAGRVASGQTTLGCLECEEQDATYTCLDCSLLLCDICMNHHNRKKKSKHHEVLRIQELKRRNLALPMPKRTCKKHKGQELKLYCNTCMVCICFDGTVQDHKGHDYSLLTDVASKLGAELVGHAEKISELQATLASSIARVTAEQAALASEAADQTTLVASHFDLLVDNLRSRQKQLTIHIEEALARKLKMLSDQRRALLRDVACMNAGSNHAKRTANLNDIFLMVKEHSHIVRGLRRLHSSSYQLMPGTGASITFIDTSDGAMAQSLLQHASIVAKDVSVCPSACVSEGQGIQEALTGCQSSFIVRAVGFDGHTCKDCGDIVQVKLVGTVLHSDTGRQNHNLAQDVCVTDKGDGTFACTYFLPVDVPEQLATLQVLINGRHTSGSPFSVAVVEPVATLDIAQAPFGRNGALYYIATKGNREYSNPHASGLVAVSMSKNLDGAQGLVIRTWFVDILQGSKNAPPLQDSQRSMHPNCDPRCSMQEEDSWVTVDLKHRLAPTSYCLELSQRYSRIDLSDWRLEGSNDGSTWMTLHVHAKGSTCAGISACAWSIQSDAAFRYFRCKKGSKFQGCTSNEFSLFQVKIELYGRLFPA